VAESVAICCDVLSPRNLAKRDFSVGFDSPVDAVATIGAESVGNAWASCDRSGAADSIRVATDEADKLEGVAMLGDSIDAASVIDRSFGGARPGEEFAREERPSDKSCGGVAPLCFNEKPMVYFASDR
jgi:hypothetical protein